MEAHEKLEMLLEYSEMKILPFSKEVGQGSQTFYDIRSGKRHVLADYVYKFWKYKIPTDKTIYALKHTFLDMVESANFNAQIAAGHRKDSTTAIYTVGRQKRRLEAQKSILIS